MTLNVMGGLQSPIGAIDLKRCITEEVGLVSRDVCARPNTFELLTVRRQQAGDCDTLVTTCYDTLSSTKYVIQWWHCEFKKWVVQIICQQSKQRNFFVP